jgi:hypothetical protein
MRELFTYGFVYVLWMCMCTLERVLLDTVSLLHFIKTLRLKYAPNKVNINL